MYNFLFLQCINTLLEGPVNEIGLNYIGLYYEHTIPDTQ